MEGNRNSRGTEQAAGSPDMAVGSPDMAAGAGRRGYMQVRLPRNQGQNADQDEFFSVNFKNYIVKRGEYVDVPPELEEVIRNGEREQEAAFRYAEEKALREA